MQASGPPDRNGWESPRTNDTNGPAGINCAAAIHCTVHPVQPEIRLARDVFFPGMTTFFSDMES